MKTKAYKFIRRLIDRITSVNHSNNDTFVYYGQSVILQSGTRDFVSVTIKENEDVCSASIADFSFDFWTKKLIIDYAVNRELEKEIINSFRKFYNKINIKSKRHGNR